MEPRSTEQATAVAQVLPDHFFICHQNKSKDQMKYVSKLQQMLLWYMFWRGRAPERIPQQHHFSFYTFVLRKTSFSPRVGARTLDLGLGTLLQRLKPSFSLGRWVFPHGGGARTLEFGAVPMTSYTSSRSRTQDPRTRSIVYSSRYTRS